MIVGISEDSFDGVDDALVVGSFEVDGNSDGDEDCVWVGVDDKDGIWEPCIEGFTDGLLDGTNDIDSTLEGSVEIEGVLPDGENDCIWVGPDDTEGSPDTCPVGSNENAFVGTYDLDGASDGLDDASFVG